MWTCLKCGVHRWVLRWGAVGLTLYSVHSRTYLSGASVLCAPQPPHATIMNSHGTRTGTRAHTPTICLYISCVTPSCVRAHWTDTLKKQSVRAPSLRTHADPRARRESACLLSGEWERDTHTHTPTPGRVSRADMRSLYRKSIKVYALYSSQLTMNSLAASQP